MPSMPQIAVGVHTLLYGFLMPQHVIDPVALLKGPFNVKGDISPVAAHCTAVIGMLGCFMALLCAGSLIQGDAKMRRLVLTCLLLVQPVGWYIQVAFPFNDPPPAFPSDMPWPLNMLTLALCVLGLAFPESESKGKQA